MNPTALSARARLALAIGVSFLAGCVPDEQTQIKPEHLSIANPTPVSSSGEVAQFAVNNERHKILLAVFDTGVDYNHPYLKDHMHFKLDDKTGKPSGAGMDFLALDEWASPRIISTSSYEFNFLTDRQKKRALDQYKSEVAYNNMIRRERMGKNCAIEALTELDPRLKPFMEPYRDLSFEDSETKHGTHVAGLMSYDNPQIGLIPYKVLPYYQTEKDEADFSVGKADRFVVNFEKAVEHARTAGVKIVNLSLGGSFEKPTNSKGSSYEANIEKYNNYKRMLTEGLTNILKKNSDMLFVAAAGNDSGWSDNESRLQYPCGVESPNMLCVGALNKDGKLAQFTNLPLNKVDLVLASGVKLISTVPADNCKYLRNQFDNVLTAGSNWTGMCNYNLGNKKWEKSAKFAESYKALIATLYDSCKDEKNLFEPMSGTSMATPVVSHLAAEAWLADPKMKPEEVIATLKKQSQVDNSRQFTGYVLKAKAPSWYKLFKAEKEESGPEVDDPNFESLTRFFPMSERAFAKEIQVAGGRRASFNFLVGNFDKI